MMPAQRRLAHILVSPVGSWPQAPMAEPTPAAAPATAVDLLRHTVATLAYRAGKVLRDVPEGFAEFRAGSSTATRVSRRAED